MAGTGKAMKEIVDTAKEAVGSLDSTEDAELRRIAFERVLDHLLENGSDPVAAGELSASPERSGENGNSPPGTEQRRVELVSDYFGIDAVLVRDAFDLGEREPVLHLPVRLVPKNKAPATKMIAVVLTAVRGKVGLETTTQDIREAVESHNRLDKANFAHTLTGMPELIVLGEPGRADRVVRLRSSGAAQAREYLSPLADAP